MSAATTRSPALGQLGRLALVGLLLVASVAPLAQVFADDAWLRPVAAAMLVSVALAWAAHQAGAGSALSAAASAVGWLVFAGAVLAPGTTRWALLPTLETLEALRALFAGTVEAIAGQSSPVTTEPALLLLAVTGVWAVAVAVHDAAVVRDAPVQAVASALVGFSIPLALAGTERANIGLTLVFLAAAAVVMLTLGGPELRRWGAVALRPTRATLVAGAGMAAVAIVSGALLAEALPGYEEPAVYQPRLGGGGSSDTTNPIVDVRARLTAEDTGAVLRVETERPVYLRTAALDVYDGEHERWTADRFVGQPIPDGTIDLDLDGVPSHEIATSVEVVDLTGALVPAPYPAAQVAGPTAEEFLHDPATGVLVMRDGGSIGPGDSYEVVARIPEADAARAAASQGFAPDGTLTRLPDDVPQRVVDLAEEIVDEAEAVTPFEQALAIQQELRGWEYSLEPPQGHTADALDAFLDTRTGYCEQYAATMAIMLRTLDVPSRVAVGYTPGTLVDPDAGAWEISDANAHAWVEVLLPTVGWVAFEPTPRSDGNVLVPSATDLFPDDTVAADADVGGGAEAPDAPDAAPEDEGMEPPVPEEPPDAAQEGAAGGGGDGGRGGWWAAAGAPLLAAGGLWLLWRRRAAEVPAEPWRRVRRARRRAEVLGAALRVAPQPSETDHEYLRRLAGRLRPSPQEPALRLAGAAALARYGRGVDEGVAETAEAAVTELEGALPRPSSPWERARRWALWRAAELRGG